MNTAEATYCPEDNKLRLYVGRVPRAEYEALRAEGWTSTPKQSCDFVATWSPNREDTALHYSGGIIGDEDQDPGDRAADRAERFAGYHGKRLTEATGHADTYEDGPAVHGYQSHARAERAATRHDRQADRALCQWGKAEYWQHRTAGVIAHALYKDLPGVRMARIKTLEAEQRKALASHAEYAKNFRAWSDIITMDADTATKAATILANCASGGYYYKHPRPESASAYVREHGTSLWSLLTQDQDPITGHEAAALWLAGATDPDSATSGPARWRAHYALRLAYENQMLEAQGGRLEQKDVEVGGKIYGKLILKVSKSPATGRVTSCAVLMPAVRNGNSWDERANFTGTEWSEGRIALERVKPEAYTAPTPDTLAELAAVKKTIKSATTKPDAPSLINPTEADAQRLQAAWNTKRSRSFSSDDTTPQILLMTQAQYSANSKGTYSSFETVEITGGGFRRQSAGHMGRPDCPVVAKVRAFGGRVVVITDKPQKPFAPAVWADPRPAIVEEVRESFPALLSATRRNWSSDMTAEEEEIFRKAQIVGLAYISSLSQFGLTDAGKAFEKSLAEVAA